MPLTLSIFLSTCRTTMPTIPLFTAILTFSTLFPKFSRMETPVADNIQWGDQTSIVFSPRPFLKTEQILVDQQPPPVKTEPADNEDVKCEVNTGFIKHEQEVLCKVDPDLLTVKTEPVEFSTFSDNFDTPASSPLLTGKLSSLSCNRTHLGIVPSVCLVCFPRWKGRDNFVTKSLSDLTSI